MTRRPLQSPVRHLLNLTRQSNVLMLNFAVGSVLLLAKDHNEPLGLRNAPARTSHSSLPTGYPHEGQKESPHPSTPSSVPPKIEDDGKKKTSDGQIILDPQPDDSGNDPLNWPAWRRDIALLSLGLYCSKNPSHPARSMDPVPNGV